MQNFMKTILSAIQTWTKGKIKDSTADWNENDLNSDRYVKNRTHWEEEEIILEKQTLEFVADPFGYYYADIQNSTVNFVKGEKYVVVLDGQRIEYISKVSDCIGNFTDGDIVCVSRLDDGTCEITTTDIIATSHEISILHKTVHKLDSKYLDIPTNLATTDDVESAKQEAQEAMDTAETAQSTAETAQSTAETAQSTAETAQSAADISFQIEWNRYSGSTLDGTVTINNITYVRKIFRTGLGYNLPRGLVGGTYTERKRTSSNSWSSYTKRIKKENYWYKYKEDGYSFGVVYNENNQPIIIATESPNTYVWGVCFPYIGIYVYEGDDEYNITGVKCHFKLRDKDTIIGVLQENLGYHTIEGNPLMLNSSTNGSTENFLLTVDDNGILTVAEESNNVVSIVASEKYVNEHAIPVPEAAEVGQLLAVKAVDKNGRPSEWEVVSETQADWNQNDSTKPDYVKNRPFWTDDPVETVLVEETTNEWVATGVEGALPLAPIDIVEGEKYIVIFDGVRYDCTAYIAEGPNSPSLGDGAIAGAGNTGSNGEPFFITVVSDTLLLIVGETGEHTVSVSGMVAEAHKIDEKYLPNEVFQSKYADKMIPVLNSGDCFNFGISHFEQSGSQTSDIEVTIEEWVEALNFGQRVRNEEIVLVNGASQIEVIVEGETVKLFCLKFVHNAGSFCSYSTVMTYDEDTHLVTATYSSTEYALTAT